MSRPPDDDARQRALTPDRSFAVSAPAGSGKTSLLTQRVLTLLARCNNPEEVLCITFTRKAAAEMRERISSAIANAARQARPEADYEQRTWDLARKVVERDRDLDWHLLQSPQRLRIQTIDGLCRSLTLMNPVSSTIGGSTRVLDHPARAYYQAADLCLQVLEADTSLAADASRLLWHFDNDRNRCMDLLVSLLANRDQWLEPLLGSREQGVRAQFESVLAELIGETLEDLADLLLPYAGELCLLADYAGRNCSETAPQASLCLLAGIDQLPDPLPASMDTWLGLSDLLLTTKDEWRKPTGLTVKQGFPPGKDAVSKARARERKQAMGGLLDSLAQVPGLLDLLCQVRYLPAAVYPQQQWRLLDSLTRLLPYCVAQLKLVFSKLNAVDYSEITQGALLALGSEDQPTELGMVLDYQICHILVDEFQDTSTSQWRLLEQLTAGWQPGDGRTLFIVGDGMQSCYSFRNANVGLFLDARHSGIGNVQLEPLDLTVNFRSQAGIVDWVNLAFASAFPPREDISRGAVCYSKSTASKPQLAGTAVTSHIFVDAADGGPEAEQVVRLVREALAASSTDRIAILVRDRGRLRYILPALRAAGIEYLANEIEPLSSRMAIQDLLSLTRALLDPADRNAWLALLRSPWIGLDNADLLAITQHPDAQPADNSSIQAPLVQQLAQWHSIPALSGEARRILQRVVPLFTRCRSERRRKSLRHTVEGLWVALGGPAGLLDSNDLENAQAYLSLLEDSDQGGWIDNWQDFLAAVEKLFAAPGGGSDVRVEVMTIHKSKGLEFDTVIIPGLGTGSRSDEAPLLIWQERINRNHRKRLLLSPLSATGDDNDPLYQFLRRESRLKQELEATRLFYVACTRAVKRLHVLGSLNSDRDSGVLQLSSGALLSRVWPLLENTANLYQIGDKTREAREIISFPGIIRRLPAAWQAPALIPGSLLAAYRGREFDDQHNLASDADFHQRHSRFVGNVLHRTLAQVVREGIDNWDAARIRRQQPFWKMQLRQQGVTGLALEQALQKVELGLRRTLDDSTGRWLLDAEHQQSAVEASYWDTAGNSILDRTFIAEQQRWIIDYKSSTPETEQPLDEFLRQQAERYRPQLLRYGQLFVEQQPRLALYFPLLATLYEIEPD